MRPRLRIQVQMCGLYFFTPTVPPPPYAETEKLPQLTLLSDRIVIANRVIGSTLTRILEFQAHLKANSTSPPHFSTLFIEYECINV